MHQLICNQLQGKNRNWGVAFSHQRCVAVPMHIPNHHPLTSKAATCMMHHITCCSFADKGQDSQRLARVWCWNMHRHCNTALLWKSLALFTIFTLQLITYQLMHRSKSLILITFYMLWWKWTGYLPFTIRHDVALCRQLACIEGVGHGPRGVRALLYTHTHTDQENGLLTTIHMKWFTLCLGTWCYNICG